MPTTITKRPPKPSDTPLLIALLLIGFAVAGIFWYGGRLHAPESPTATGQDLYNQYCAACHSFEGEGNVTLQAPALNSTGTTSELTDGEIQRIILNGGEIMPPFDEILTNANIADIIRYIQTWWTDEQLAAQQIRSQQDPLQP